LLAFSIKNWSKFFKLKILNKKPFGLKVEPAHPDYIEFGWTDLKDSINYKQIKFRKIVTQLKKIFRCQVRSYLFRASKS